MSLDVRLMTAEATLPWRELHRREMNCQIIHDSWLGRGWVDSYALIVAGETVGYGLVGGVRADPKDTVEEFFLLPEHRGAAQPLFQRLLEVSGPSTIEVQTNDRLLTLMAYDFARELTSPVILFHDGLTTRLPANGAVFRSATTEDAAGLAAGELDQDAKHLLELDGAVIAAGGILTHYNPPYGDIYMAVVPSQRRRGFGAYFVQELKRTAYETGLIPAARCNATNIASRATLQRAGLFPCARMLIGKL